MRKPRRKAGFLFVRQNAIENKNRSAAAVHRDEARAGFRRRLRR
jgi:hypothetical protein